MKPLLIDFTRNIFIALFFACHGNPKEDGELIILSTEDVATLKEISYEGASPKKIAMVEPARTQDSRNRVLNQSSVFLYTPEGYLPKGKCQTQRIPKELKEPLLDYLQQCRGINIETIYERFNWLY